MKRNSKEGFTIIEVVMVLAIAGLIFAVVFSAFPRVQRARRDSQRKNDLAALAGELEFFQSSNRGRYPADPTELVDEVINNMNIDFKDPQTNVGYIITAPADPLALALALDEPGKIYYQVAAQCNDDNTGIENSGFNRTYAIVVKLEAGFHCLDT